MILLTTFFCQHPYAIFGLLIGILLVVLLFLGKITAAIAILLFILMSLGHLPSIIIAYRIRRHCTSRTLRYFTVYFLMSLVMTIGGIVTGLLLIFNYNYCTWSDDYGTSDMCYATSILFITRSLFCFTETVLIPIRTWITYKKISNRLNISTVEASTNELRGENPERNTNTEMYPNSAINGTNCETSSTVYEYQEVEYRHPPLFSTPLSYPPLPSYDLVCGPESRSPPPYTP